MRILIQRVSSASVTVEESVVGEIGQGILLLVGFQPDDENIDLSRPIERVLDMRIFEDEEGKMNRSLRDIEGELLVVSQFTLYGDCSKGRRPSFVHAAPGDMALKLYNKFLKTAEGVYPGGVRAGEFGAHMHVELVNDGPVTLMLDSG